MENLANNFIRNGAGRFFLVASISSTTVVLEEYTGAGASHRFRNIPRIAFEALWARKNYVITRFAPDATGRWSELYRDYEAERSFSAHRFMVRNRMPLK